MQVTPRQDVQLSTYTTHVSVVDINERNLPNGFEPKQFMRMVSHVKFS